MTVYDYVKVLANERCVDIKTIENACGIGNGTISKWGNSIPKAAYRLVRELRHCMG